VPPRFTAAGRSGSSVGLLLGHRCALPRRRRADGAGVFLVWAAAPLGDGPLARRTLRLRQLWRLRFPRLRGAAPGGLGLRFLGLARVLSALGCEDAAHVGAVRRQRLRCLHHLGIVVAICGIKHGDQLLALHPGGFARPRPALSLVRYMAELAVDPIPAAHLGVHVQAWPANAGEVLRAALRRLHEDLLRDLLIFILAVFAAALRAGAGAGAGAGGGRRRLLRRGLLRVALQASVVPAPWAHPSP